ncbi:hypothetical protein AB0H71_05640 [Nocardia sp. NPDC050697]|uniref:hypothetical protein n=1 Tax=Nocardia sp. NPDC050697 TaxID=3155158 RepID=UPI00340D8B42
MDPLTTVVEFEVLRNLKARYCRLLDTRDFAKVCGAGHYHESYVKADGRWRIATLELTRTLLELPR